jgi:hypothetical protein
MTAGELKGKMSVEALAKHVSNYEKDLQPMLSKANGKNKKELDQGTRMGMHSKVQTWINLLSSATGIVRAIGDGLTALAQNLKQIFRNKGFFKS